MGAALTQPETTKKSDHGEGLGLRYGLSSMQGWRTEMEDAHVAQLGLKYGLDDWSFFAVFDGHAGKSTADFASSNLLDYILKAQELQLDTSSWSGPVTIGTDGEAVESPQTLVGSDVWFLKLEGSKPPEDSSTSAPAEGGAKDKDDQSSIEAKAHEESKKTDEIDSGAVDNSNPKETMQDLVSKFKSKDELEQVCMFCRAIKSGFLEADKSMKLHARDMSGCTAICVLISPKHIIFANCGDSRAVLYGSELKFSTCDHKPYLPKERLRIMKAGGVVTQRINGTLAVSRALGDFEFKKDELRGPCEQLVSPEPEVDIASRKPDDEFLILACDGIWDVIDNVDLCKYVKYKLEIESNLEKVCSSVLDLCLRKGSRDNMSIIIVVFEGGPKVQPEKIEEDRIRDEFLLGKIDELLDLREYPDTDFALFFEDARVHLYDHVDILPPSGGIYAKYDLIRKKFDQKYASSQSEEVKE